MFHYRIFYEIGHACGIKFIIHRVKIVFRRNFILCWASMWEKFVGFLKWLAEICAKRDTSNSVSNSLVIDFVQWVLQLRYLILYKQRVGDLDLESSRLNRIWFCSIYSWWSLINLIQLYEWKKFQWGFPWKAWNQINVSDTNFGNK